jgi:hypothetical protein
MHIRPYAATDSGQWDEFCANSINATFLHSRLFLSYHGERFKDLSCIVERNGEWLAILPAAEHPAQPDAVVSHPGISYGGLLHAGRLAGEDTLHAFTYLVQYYRNLNYRNFYYKLIPHIYPLSPAQDDIYALFRLKANRYRCDLSTAIDLEARLKPSERRRRALRKANQAGLVLVENNKHLAEFWLILADNLTQKHKVKPAHTLAEIQELVNRFPDNIKLVCALKDGKVVGGTVLFITTRVFHAQYTASNRAGHESCAMDAVFQHCIEMAQGRGRYFDFGVSSENEGWILNEGLCRFKTEFGGSGVVHEFYHLPLHADIAENQ